MTVPPSPIRRARWRAVICTLVLVLLPALALAAGGAPLHSPVTAGAEMPCPGHDPVAGHPACTPACCHAVVALPARPPVGPVAAAPLPRRPAATTPPATRFSDPDPPPPRPAARA